MLRIIVIIDGPELKGSDTSFVSRFICLLRIISRRYLRHVISFVDKTLTAWQQRYEKNELVVV